MPLMTTLLRSALARSALCSTMLTGALSVLLPGAAQASTADCDALVADAIPASAPVRLTLSDGHALEVARFGRAADTRRYAIEVTTPRGCLVEWRFIRVGQYNALVGEWNLTLTNGRTLTSPRGERADQALWLTDGDRRWHFVPPAAAFAGAAWDKQKFWVTSTDKPDDEVAVVPGLIAGFESGAFTHPSTASDEAPNAQSAGAMSGASPNGVVPIDVIPKQILNAAPPEALFSGTWVVFQVNGDSLRYERSIEVATLSGQVQATLKRIVAGKQEVLWVSHDGRVAPMWADTVPVKVDNQRFTGDGLYQCSWAMGKPEQRNSARDSRPLVGYNPCESTFTKSKTGAVLSILTAVNSLGLGRLDERRLDVDKVRTALVSAVQAMRAP